MNKLSKEITDTFMGRVDKPEDAQKNKELIYVDSGNNDKMVEIPSAQTSRILQQVDGLIPGAYKVSVSYQIDSNPARSHTTYKIGKQTFEVDYASALDDEIAHNKYWKVISHDLLWLVRSDCLVAHRRVEADPENQHQHDHGRSDCDSPLSVGIVLRVGAGFGSVLFDEDTVAKFICGERTGSGKLVAGICEVRR